MKNLTKTDVYFNQLQTLLNQGMITLAPKLIFQLDNGDYEVHRKYRIHSDTNNYVVHRHRDEKVVRFNKLKNAVTWCLIDDRGVIHTGERIQALDMLQTAVDTEILQHQRFIKDCSLELYGIYLTKLTENLVKQKRIQKELDGYVRDARERQLMEIENATKRDGHKRD